MSVGGLFIKNVGVAIRKLCIGFGPIVSYSFRFFTFIWGFETVNPIYAQVLGTDSNVY